MKASMGLTIGFVSVVVVACVALLWALAGHVREGESQEDMGRWRLGSALCLLCWLALTGWLAYSGVLRQFAAMPPPFGVLIAVNMTLTFGLAFSPAGARILRRTPLVVLVLAQGLRIPIELALHQLYAEGLLPVQMTYVGMNFDILSGISALFVAWLLWKGKLPNWGLLLWNIVGLGLLLTIVTIAILSVPFPFRVFMNEPSNTIVSYPPFIWLPTILVQMALLGHLLVFRWLWRQRKSRVA